jgi:hypothetical protein
MNLFAQMSLPGGVTPRPPTWHDNLRALIFDLSGLAVPPVALVFLAGAIAAAGLFVVLRMDRPD